METPTKPLRHKWKSDICVVCGCRRKRFRTGIFYERSGIEFSEIPECIDWKVENEKTID